MTPSTLPVETDQDFIQSFTFLLKAYELSAEEKDHSIGIWDVGREIGLNEVDAESVASDLQEMNLLYYSSLAGDVALTSFGVSEIVLARSRPDHATTHFPPLSTMSEQMMLPLSSKHLASVDTLVGQLESFSLELSQISESELDLNPFIDVLDQQLRKLENGPQFLVPELEDLKLSLQ